MVIRAALFASVGLVFFAHWLVTDPGYDMNPSHSGWSYVLAFSGVLLLLALAIPVLAQRAGGRHTLRASFVAAGGSGLSSLANVFEDGLEMSWMFFVFVLGSAIQLIGLVALSILIALRARNGRRLLALVPMGTATGILLYVAAGGPIMLVTWLTAGVLALANGRSVP